MPDPSAETILIIVGPTASGKTEAGIRAAQRLGGEVVSADSRQVYRGMDVGTAKPTPGQRSSVPHHLIDVVDPSDGYNAGRFGRDAQEAIGAISSRGRRAVVVGGCGLYIRALLDGFCPVPGISPDVRDRLMGEVQGIPTPALHARLSRIDPLAAGRICPTDRQRVLRALEVYEGTGEPLSSWQARPREGAYPGKAMVVGLRMDRNALRERIEDRTERMFEGGLVEEVDRLHRRGYTPQNSALRTFGYREVFDCLMGKIPVSEAIRLVKRETCRYAKRQMTWFRAEARIRWLDAGSPDLTDEVVAHLDRDAT